MSDVHLDWDPDAKVRGEAPNCLGGTHTEEFGDVTCPRCIDRLIEIVAMWVKEKGTSGGQAT